MNIRPLVCAIFDILSNLYGSKIKGQYKGTGILISLVSLAIMIWPYVEGVKIMVETTMITNIAIIIGAFVGPLLLELKAKTMGNEVDKLDFIGAILGMVFGGMLFGYIAATAYADALTAYVGDLSYIIVGLGSAAILGGLATLMCQAFLGDSWAINVLDRNKNGKLDVGDLTTGATEVAKLVTDGKAAVSTAENTLNEAIKEAEKK